MSVKRRKRIQKIGLEKMPEGIGHVLTEWTSHGDGRNRIYGFVNKILPPFWGAETDREPDIRLGHPGEEVRYRSPIVKSNGPKLCHARLL